MIENNPWPGKKKSKSPAKRGMDAPATERLDFTALVAAIRQAHEHCAARAGRAVNVSLTLRNWTIGAYIHHYEMNGQDRAEYGDGLLNALAVQLTALKVSNCNRRQLYRYLRFFRIYPDIWGTAEQPGSRARRCSVGPARCPRRQDVGDSSRRAGVEAASIYI